jgi:hypothetical protein
MKNTKSAVAAPSKALQQAQSRLVLALAAHAACQPHSASAMKAYESVLNMQAVVIQLEAEARDRFQQQQDAAIRRANAADKRAWGQGLTLGARLPQLRSL